LYLALLDDLQRDALRREDRIVVTVKPGAVPQLTSCDVAAAPAPKIATIVEEGAA